MPRLDFIPDRDGFHFDNSFGNQILPGTPFTFTTYGLCGGMAMAALDHWRSGVPVPTHVEDQFKPVVRPDLGLVPAVGTQLRAYIYGRLLDSLLTKAMFTRWITFPWIGPQQFHDWAVGSEFDLVRGIIDSGQPAMLGLWTMGGSPATGHQVLAYGYDEGPRQALHLRPEPSRRGVGVHAGLTEGGRREPRRADRANRHVPGDSSGPTCTTGTRIRPTSHATSISWSPTGCTSMPGRRTWATRSRSPRR